MSIILLLYLGIFAGAVYVGVGLVLYFMQPKFLYRPVRDVPFTPADMDLDFEDVTFHSEGGVALNGWFVPAPNAPFTVLFCHGNAGNIMHRLNSVELFHGLGLNCFVFDYRGYGKSEGRPTEDGTYADARAAYDWLTRTKHVPPEQIVLFGRSLGGSIAAHLAGRVNARGLVIENAFTSYIMAQRIRTYCRRNKLTTRKGTLHCLDGRYEHHQLWDIVRNASLDNEADGMRWSVRKVDGLKNMYFWF